MIIPRLLIAASAALFVSAAVLAQSPPPVVGQPSFKVGAAIYDPQGGEVGKIDSVATDSVVVDTGAHKAALPKTAFAAGPKGPTTTVTKAQIDAQVASALDKAAAELSAALVPGAEVRGKAGTVIGTVKELAGDQVVVSRSAGPVSLPKQAFGRGPDGLFIAMTADELDAAAKAAAPSS